MLFTHNEGQGEVRRVEPGIRRAAEWHRILHPRFFLEVPHIQRTFARSGASFLQTARVSLTFTHHRWSLSTLPQGSADQQHLPNNLLVSVYFFHIKKSNLAQFDISFRNIACWLTIIKIPWLDSSKNSFIWPLVVLNNKQASSLLLQNHWTL